MSSRWWFCARCEAANEETVLTCVVCEGPQGRSLSDGGLLRGDLVRRSTPRATTSATEPFLRPSPPRITPATCSVRMPWQQRVRAGARRVYDRCAELIRRIAEALS
jgi:hypothetical protein